MSESLRIVKLEAANVKRLTAVQITPDGNLVVIGGKNGAGKSSVLDSIAFALGGKDLVCDEPLRQGAEKGHVEVNLGKLVVRRTFTPGGGGSLTVSNAEGAVFRSPQAILDALVGELSFDPLGFARMAPGDQREALSALVGLDFSQLDAKRAEVYEERAGLNRALKQGEARLADMPQHPDAPAELVSIAALAEELDAARSLVADANEAIKAAREWEADIGTHERRHAAALDAIVKVEKALADARAVAAQELAHVEASREGAAKAKARAEELQAREPDLAAIRARIAEAETVNAKVRENAARRALSLELAGHRGASAGLTERLDVIDAEKAQALAAAAFPVPGLSFDEESVRLNGVPFSQASSAEQLRVSVAMGLAANPRLRVLLIRDGSLLDDESLELVAKMAAEADAQVWLERVGDGAECSVVIEDGAVRAGA